MMDDGKRRHAPATLRNRDPILAALKGHLPERGTVLEVASGNGRLALRGGKFGAFVACSNYPECKFTRKFGQGGDAATASSEPADLGEGIMLKTGRFGPYVTDGTTNASLPKGADPAKLTMEEAVELLKAREGVAPKKGGARGRECRGRNRIVERMEKTRAAAHGLR